MKKVNKSLALFLSVVLFIGLFPIPGYADALEFEVDELGLLTAYNGPGGSITIPAEVMGIEAGVFTAEDQITEIFIPNEYIYLGSNAFSACDQLTDVYFYRMSAYIDPAAFEGLNQVTLHGLNGSTAERFASQQGMEFEPLPVWTHQQSGVSVQTKPYENATLQVNQITAGAIYDSIAAPLANEGLQVALYEIQLTDSNGTPYPVDASLVTIPRPASFGRFNVMMKVSADVYGATLYMGMDREMAGEAYGMGLFLVINIPYLNGDIDMNASISTTDARLLLQYVVGKIDIVDYMVLIYDELVDSLQMFYPDMNWEEMDEEDFRLFLEVIIAIDEMFQTSEFKNLENLLHGFFDVDGDGKITATDARLILQMAVGKIEQV